MQTTCRRYSANGHRRATISLGRNVVIYRSAGWPPNQWYLALWGPGGVKTSWIDRVAVSALLRLAGGA